MKDFIAKILYHLGFQPKATTFIDGETTSYGYGKLDGSIGMWEYQLPLDIKKTQENNKGDT